MPSDRVITFIYIKRSIKRFKRKQKQVRADIRIRIRRGIIRIKIERTCFITIIPITTEIENVRRIQIAIICLLFFNRQD